MKDFFYHLFLPRESNNYRARLLHHKTLLLFIAFIFAGSFFLRFIKTNFPSVLGISANITSEQLLLLTNQKRQENGLPPLVLNSQLSQAALSKAEDMFVQDYWAHNAPDGKTPWVFIKNAGYNYVYAGENLARGFESTGDVVNAWMASPKHRENVLFKNYSDVGFAVKIGKLKGEDTVLVVEEFGNQNFGSRQAIATSSSARSKALPRVFAVSVDNNKKPFLNSLSLSLNLDRTILILFIFVLILDMVIVERKRIVRLVGHNVDHIFFLVLIILIVAVVSKGVII